MRFKREGFIFILPCILIFGISCHTSRSKSKLNKFGCEDALIYLPFKPNNHLNDTDKVSYIWGANDDTDVCSLEGHIIDREDRKPIANASLVFSDEQTTILAWTDKEGDFHIPGYYTRQGIGKINYLAHSPNFKLAISAGKYQCMNIDSIPLNKAQFLRILIKLQQQ